MSPPSEGESVSRLRSMEQDRVGSQSGQRTQAEATDTGTEGQPGPQHKPESREEGRLPLAHGPRSATLRLPGHPLEIRIVMEIVKLCGTSRDPLPVDTCPQEENGSQAV